MGEAFMNMKWMKLTAIAFSLLLSMMSSLEVAQSYEVTQSSQIASRLEPCLEKLKDVMSNGIQPYDISDEKWDDSMINQLKIILPKKHDPSVARMRYFDMDKSEEELKAQPRYIPGTATPSLKRKYAIELSMSHFYKNYIHPSYGIGYQLAYSYNKFEWFSFFVRKFKWGRLVEGETTDYRINDACEIIFGQKQWFTISYDRERYNSAQVDTIKDITYYDGVARETPAYLYPSPYYFNFIHFGSEIAFKKLEGDGFNFKEIKHGYYGYQLDSLE